MLYPMRIVASWGFLKMKRWGFQAMTINMWASIFFWLDYLMNFTMGFNDRMPFAEFGTLGWWIVDLWYSDFLLPLHRRQEPLEIARRPAPTGLQGRHAVSHATGCRRVRPLLSP
jgi:hypothetical protein